MKKVESLSEYKERIRNNKASRNRVDTNCCLMSGAVEAFIVKGCLYAEEYAQGLVFYVDEGSYYNLYYFWESGEPLPDLKQEKPVLLEELSNNGSRDAYLSGFEPRLMQAGFSLFKHNLQVAASFQGSEQALRDTYLEKKAQLEAQGFRIEACADAACMEAVAALWESALNPTDIPQAHKILAPDNRVMCIFDSENTLCAAKWWHHGGKTSEGRHVVTDKNFMRRGLGAALQLAWLTDGFDCGAERYLTWIADTNHASLAMHEKAGFLCNGRSSKQYILK